MQAYQHWRLEKDKESILWLSFDRKGASTNTINKEVMVELDNIIHHISKESYRGVIIGSAKSSGFIAGADIAQFTQFRDSHAATELLRQGQAILDQLAALPIPTVAMINGFCLGGGLELSLACRYRVAEDSPKTRIGLPEVKLGIHPGWGGTVRLPRLIGVSDAFRMILAGSTVPAKVAGKLGIVDAVVPARHLKDAARFYVLKTPKQRRASLLQRALNLKPMRLLLSKIFQKTLRSKIDPLHYPAPFRVIDNWKEVNVTSPDAFDREAETCGELFVTDTCQNLVRLFFLQDRLKGLAKSGSFEFKHVHVIGAGTMGGDIAAWCALQGMRVTLQDREPKYIAPALKRAYALFKEKLKEPNLVQRAFDRLIPDVEGSGIAKADVIIEAIFEDLTAKQNLFKLIESKAKPDALFATNTSSIPLDEINVVLKQPERLVGIHFFNPVAKMQLVEVVKGERSAPVSVDKALAFVRKLDRLPLPVKSSPGFLINRILMPYLLESVALLNEGVPGPVIDKAMVQFGMPMGPIMLSDVVGLDICLSVAKNLGQHYHREVPQLLIDKVAEGKLGRKTGQGFYRYDKSGKLIKPKSKKYEHPLSDISDRLVMKMLEESFACLQENVVADADLLDAGMVFGTGFAPFRGGPIHYAKACGLEVTDEPVT